MPISTWLVREVAFTCTAAIPTQQEANCFDKDEVEQLHSKCNKQLTESVRCLESVVSSEDDKDFSDEM